MEIELKEGPSYVSFVSKAILWDRGPCNYTAHNHPHPRPVLCPRFLAHMRSRPEDLRPPCFLSSKSRPQPPSQGRTPTTHALTAPKTQTLEGSFPLSPDRGRTSVQNQAAGRRSAVIVPCPPLLPPPLLHPPPSSAINPTPPHQNTPRPESSNQTSVPASPASSSPAPEKTDEPQEMERVPQPAVMSITESDWELHPVSAGPDQSPSPSRASVVSHGSLSDLSRPPSSLFSRSTDLASGRSSVLSDLLLSDSEGSVRPSSLQPRPVMLSPSASYLPEGSSSHQSPTNSTTSPPLQKPQFGPNEPISPRPSSAVLPPTDKPLSGRESTKMTPVEPPLNPHSDSDPGLITLAFPSATWSSCPSPRTTPPRSGSGLNLTSSASVTRLESHRWPVLPPISPTRGRCGTAASGYSELSCSQSHVFDELEAIAPRSTSCPSLDRPLDSSGCPSPDTELSPGLAALTVGCDSGNLGAISRVQLLLLDRWEPETAPSPFDYEEELLPVEDWPNMSMHDDAELTSAGVSRPLTAGGDSERCDSAGKVQGNKSDESEGGSGSPSSWIIDPSPSHDPFRSSPCKSDHGSSSDDESNYPGWRRPGSEDHSSDEKDRRMEERKTKALNMLSKLQDDAPRQTKRNKGRSNFEEFDFLAKFCIFSQEKLAEYKRAFEAEDADGDGYISCLQTLLALKNILPAELLSDEEEIYVYRILEMVDFRVTDGLVDLRLFAVIASLAQKIATMDDFMRSLISSMDFRSLEVRLFKAKQLFLFLLEEQRGGTGAQPGFISAEQLLLELKAGGIQLEQEAAVRLELQHVPPLDLLDFLAYLPLFMLIHKSVISNPLDSSGDL